MLTSLLIVVYLIVLLVLAWRRRTVSSQDDFLMGGRSAKSYEVGASVFTLIGGGELLAMASLAFVFGWSAMALFIGYAVGFAALGLLAATVRARSHLATAVSLPDFLYVEYGLWGSLPAFVLSFLAFMALLLLQFGAGGVVVADATGWPLAWSVVAVGSAVIAYLVIGGFRAVLVTDVVQGAAMVVLMAVLVGTLVIDGSLAAVDSPTLPRSLWLSLTVTGAIVAVGSADVWQRLFAAESTASARRGFFGAAGLFLLYGSALASVGIGARALDPTIDPDSAFTFFLSEALTPAVMPFAILLVLAAIMSTADTEIFLLTGLVLKELDRPLRPEQLSGRDTGIWVARSAVCLIGLTATGAAVFFADLVAIYTWLLNLLLVLSPLVIGSLFRPIRPAAFACLAIIGTVVLMVGAASGWLTLENAYWLGLGSFGIYLATAVVLPHK